MKIKALQTYQSVAFQTKRDNFFSNAVSSMADLEIRYDKEMQAAVLTTAKDCIIVFPANIAYMVPETAVQASKDPKGRAKLDIDPTKAPKTT